MSHGDPTLEQKVRDLKEERSGIHPDKSGGEFLSTQAQKRYFEIEKELEQLRSLEQVPSQQLIPVSQLPALIEALGGAIALKNHQSAQDLEREFRRASKLDLSRKYRPPKISSGVAAAVVGFLFTQAPALAEHPLMGPFFASQTGLIVLGYAFFLSLGVLALAWFRERREASLIANLMSRNILAEVLKSLESLPAGHLFEETELRHLLFRHAMRWNRSVLFPSLDEETFDNVFDVQLQRLIEREVLRESPVKRGIDRIFEKL